MIKVCCVDEKKKKGKSGKTTCREFNMADAKKNESFGRMVNVKSTKDRKKKMKIRKNNIKSGKNLI